MITPPTPPTPQTDAGQPPPKRRRPWLWCLLIAVGLVVLAVAAIWGFVMFVYHDY